MRKNMYYVLILLFASIMLAGCESEEANKPTVEMSSSPKIVVENLTENGKGEVQNIADSSSGEEAETNNEILAEEVPSTEEDVISDEEEGLEEGANEADNKDSNESTKVDLIFFMGQSNMAGYGGDAGQAPSVSTEAGEEFRVISDPTRLYPIQEPFGLYEDNPNGLSDRPDAKKGSLVSAFVNEYHLQTGRKVVAVSNAVGGMAMDLWLTGDFFKDSVSRVQSSREWLLANGYEIEHTYLLWFQGESDASRQVDPQEYKSMFYKFMNPMIENGVDQIFLIIPMRDGTDDCRIYDLQEEICANDSHFSIGSRKASDFTRANTVDTIHLDQNSLNIIGEDAARNVAEYLGQR